MPTASAPAAPVSRERDCERDRFGHGRVRRPQRAIELVGRSPARARDARQCLSLRNREGLPRAPAPIPEGWRKTRLEDGKSGNSFGILTRPCDKAGGRDRDRYGAIHESLVEFGAGRWLGSAVAATDLVWSSVEASPRCRRGVQPPPRQSQAAGARRRRSSNCGGACRRPRGPIDAVLLVPLADSAPGGARRYIAVGVVRRYFAIALCAVLHFH